MPRSPPRPQHRSARTPKKPKGESKALPFEFGQRSISEWAAHDWEAAGNTIAPRDPRTYNAFFNPDYGAFRFYSQPNQNARLDSKTLGLGNSLSPLDAYGPPVDSAEELEDKTVREGVETVGTTLRESGAFACPVNHPPGLGRAQMLHYIPNGWKIISTKCAMRDDGRLIFCHDRDCLVCLPSGPALKIKEQLQQHRASSVRPKTSVTATSGGLESKVTPSGEPSRLPDRPAAPVFVDDGDLSVVMPTRPNAQRERALVKKDSRKQPIHASPTPPITPTSGDFPPLLPSAQMTKAQTKPEVAPAPTLPHYNAHTIGLAARNSHGETSKPVLGHTQHQQREVPVRPSSRLSATAPVFSLNATSKAPAHPSGQPIFDSSFKPAKYGDLSSQARPGTLGKRSLMLPLGMRRTTPDGVALKRFLRRKEKNGQVVDRKLSALFGFRRVSATVREEVENEAEGEKETERADGGVVVDVAEENKKQVEDAIVSPAYSPVPRVRLPTCSTAALSSRAPPFQWPSATPLPASLPPPPARHAVTFAHLHPAPILAPWTRNDQRLLNRLIGLDAKFQALGGHTSLYALSTAPWSIRQRWTIRTQRLHDKLARFEADFTGRGGLAKINELRGRYRATGQAEAGIKSCVMENGKKEDGLGIGQEEEEEDVQTAGEALALFEEEEGEKANPPEEEDVQTGGDSSALFEEEDGGETKKPSEEENRHTGLEPSALLQGQIPTPQDLEQQEAARRQRLHDNLACLKASFLKEKDQDFKDMRRRDWPVDIWEDHYGCGEEEEDAQTVGDFFSLFHRFVRQAGQEIEGIRVRLLGWEEWDGILIPRSLLAPVIAEDQQQSSSADKKVAAATVPLALRAADTLPALQDQPISPPRPGEDAASSSTLMPLVSKPEISTSQSPALQERDINATPSASPVAVATPQEAQPARKRELSNGTADPHSEFLESDTPALTPKKQDAVSENEAEDEAHNSAAPPATTTLPA